MYQVCDNLKSLSCFRSDSAFSTKLRLQFLRYNMFKTIFFFFFITEKKASMIIPQIQMVGQIVNSGEALKSSFNLGI